MRSWLSVALVLVLFFGSVPLAVAQEGEREPQDVRVEDTQGDVVIMSPAGAQSASSDWDHVDILETWLGKETEEAVQLGIVMASLDPPNENAWWVGQAFIMATFAFNEMNYRVMVYGNGGGCQDAGEGAAPLQLLDPASARWITQECVPGVVDAGESSRVYTIAKKSILDRNHVPLRFEDQLSGFYVDATAQIFPGASWCTFCPVSVGSVAANDRAPDQATAPPFVSAVGTAGKGDLFLSVEEPIRVSNGESTTIVYNVELANLGSEAQTALLSVQNPEPSFSVRVPARLDIEPGSTIRFPVIVAMEFTHRHSETAVFTVRAESLAEKDWFSEVDLGVHWTSIAQPAGHHDTLYLHSMQFESEDDNPLFTAFTGIYPFVQAWMNAEPVDDTPGVTDQNVPAFFNEGFFTFGGTGGGGGMADGYSARWDFPLSPSLLIGLDFDTESEGFFSTKIRAMVPSNEAVVVLELRYCDPRVAVPNDNNRPGNNNGGNQGCDGAWRTVAYGSSEVTAFAANSERTFEFPVQIDATADLLPYKHGANLNLVVRLLTETPQNANAPQPHPELSVQESYLTLPLIEYHDPIDQAFAAVGSLSLEPLSDFERPVNPGEVTSFVFSLGNAGEEDQKVGLSIEGVNTEWAGFVGATNVTLRGGESRNVTLYVQAPLGSSEGERAELFVVAQDEDDANVVAFSRVRASVVDPKNLDVEDEAATVLGVEEVDSPGLGFLALLAAVGGVIVARRRRD